MKYLLLVHLDQARMEKQSKEEWAKLDANSIEYDRVLERAGHYIASSALRPPEEAVIVRPQGDTFTTTDGPFAEVKEHLGGFIFIEARDLNEAIAIAAKIPVGQFGAIEVRPTLEF